MSKVSDAELIKEIEKILNIASEQSKSTSLKSVRLELEKKFDIELTDRKQFISKTIAECVKKMEEESEEESAEEKEEEEEEEPQVTKKKLPKRAAAKAKAAPKSRRKKADDEDFGKGSKKKAKGKGKSNNGYTRPWTLSPALAKLLGEESMPRYEVVKKMWALIKERNLYDPNNKQFALCDDALYSVIGTKRFRIFAMMKYLKNHFLD